MHSGCNNPILTICVLRYVDDDDRSNEIESGDASFSNVVEYDDRNGRRAEQTITFQPQLQTLCDLNLDDACVDDDDDFNQLNFNLICKVEQPQFPDYTGHNNQMQTQVRLVQIVQ